MKRASVLLRIFGYYVLEIPRGTLEDFLNLCLRYGFSYYSIDIDEDKRRAFIKISSWERAKILTACRMWQIRVISASQKGLYGRLKKYRGRWGIPIGAAVAVLIFLASQSVVWRIDIVGNERLSREVIVESLADNGFEVGKRITGLDLNSIEQRVMINDDRIAWISIKVVGTVALVEVVEVIDTEIEEKKTQPANIVARYDAQIVGMEVYSGFLSVKEGDFVRAGELLISGIHKEGKSPLRFSRASGRILGKVSHTIEVEIPLVQSKKVQTGDKFEKKTLIFFGKTINFFRNYRNLPASYDIINYIYTFDPFSIGELPVSVVTEEYYPYELVDVEISESEAMDLAYGELRARIDEELPDAVILKKVLHGELTDGKYVLKCTLTAICDISKQIEFEVINPTND